MKVSVLLVNLLSFAHLLFGLLACAVTLNAQSPTLHLHANQSLADLPTVGDDPPEFQAKVAFGRFGLDPIAIMMLGTEALANLAQKDHREYSTGEHFVTADFADVVINVSAVRRGGFQNGIATLCIYQGMAHLLSLQKYKNVVIDCFWDRVKTAEVQFARAGWSSSSTNSSSSTKTITEHANNTAGLRPAINETILSAVRPVFRFMRNGQDLDIPLALITIMAALKEFSFHCSIDPVMPSIISAGSQWDACMIFGSQEKIRTTPPFYEYRWAIETVRQLAYFLYVYRRFAEVSIIVVVDQIALAAALLEKGKPSDDNKSRSYSTIN